MVPALGDTTNNVSTLFTSVYSVYIYISHYLSVLLSFPSFSLIKSLLVEVFLIWIKDLRIEEVVYCRNCKAHWDDFVILGYIKLTVNNCKNDNWVRMQITIQWEHYEINLCMVAIKYAVNHIEQVFSVSCKDAPLTGFLMSFPRNRFAGLTPPTERELPLAPQIWQLTSKGREKKRGWHKAYSIIMSITWL